jgi:hypothetical protein
MSNDQSLAKINLTCGIQIEIRENLGFANSSEFALFTNDQLIGSYRVDKKKENLICIKTSLINKMIKITVPSKSQEKSAPTLADIVQ